MLQKISISNNCFWTFYSLKNPEQKCITVSTKILSSTIVNNKTLIIIRNVSWAANQYIRLISEGSCDTEDWSNDAENSTFHHRNKLLFIIYSHIKQLL